MYFVPNKTGNQLISEQYPYDVAGNSRSYRHIRTFLSLNDEINL